MMHGQKNVKFLMTVYCYVVDVDKTQFSSYK
jgi:hypothetical protein